MNAEHEALYFIFVHGTDPWRHLRRLLKILGQIVPFLDRWKLRQPDEWYRIGSDLRETLHREFPAANFEEHPWSGALNQHSRFEAALELSQTLREAKTNYRQVCIITHSHGGNIALQALRSFSSPDIYLVTMVTPFIHVNLKKTEARAWQLIFFSVLLLILPLTPILFFAALLISGSIGQYLLWVLLWVLFVMCIVGAFIWIDPKQLLDRISARFFTKQRKRYSGIYLNPRVRTLILTHKLDEFFRLSRRFRRTTNVRANIKIFDKYLSFFDFKRYMIIGLGCALAYGLNKSLFGENYAIDLAVAVVLVFATAWGAIGVVVQFFINVTLLTYAILQPVARIASLNPIEAVAVLCSTKSVVPIEDAGPTPQNVEYKNFEGAPGSGRWTHTSFQVNAQVINSICQWVRSQLTSSNR